MKIKYHDNFISVDLHDNFHFIEMIWLNLKCKLEIE